MWQAEVRVDLDAIRHNVEVLRAGTTAEVMAVVKGDGYGHGLVPSARAALAGGATWLGVATLDEGLRLREAGLEVPILAWLHAPGLPLHRGVEAGLGPSVEISWLSEANQLQTLKFTFAKGAPTDDVTAMNAKLLALAKAMDTTD